MRCEDDEIYHGDIGPLCEQCYDDYTMPPNKY